MAMRFVRLFSTRVYQRTAQNNAVGGQSLVEKVAITNNGAVVVAWHPDKPFPYEFSKAIPKAVDAQNGGLIKETALRTAMNAFKNKNPEVARQELMQLTHTTKHRWFLRSRDKRAKDTPMDRPYL
ncbi:39S ribosomal protein L42, mitochondrial [Rhagoletis pomonella]|uniref:39S ribosomal protein L42, mitochondrial n=1 Tax=Rhagoletis pomonella TaxID=28610 RepID=UPI0017859454|nr:39S ribosomal protein L42, mitochondrial [Rhagoletis pomonella]